MKKNNKALTNESAYRGFKVRGIANKNELITAMRAMIPNALKVNDIVFVCIGTDRSTGDSLGPLVGSYLEGLGYKNVYGTVDSPVHAVNLNETINNLPKNKVVIAIDASLGNSTDVGNISLIKGSLKPGAGVGKDLIEAGDYSLCGVVNVAGFMEHFVLQNTRLSLVMKLAKDIVSGITNTFPLEEESKRKNNDKFVSRADDIRTITKLKKKGLNVAYLQNT